MDKYRVWSDKSELKNSPNISNNFAKIPKNTVIQAYQNVQIFIPLGGDHDDRRGWRRQQARPDRRS